MKNFSYVKAGSLAQAIKALSGKGAWLHAGGTDLLGCIHDDIIPVEKVVSISSLTNLKGISSGSGGSMKIGALTPVADIAANASLAAKCAVLVQAAAAVGSPQIRQQGTIGGNLCQRPRCWYFRSEFECRKKGGSTCYAMAGENQYHAIFGGGPCFFVHPSDIAVALSAAQAQLVVAGSSGNKVVKIEEFFVSPKDAILKENVLSKGEVLTEIRIPAVAGDVKSSYRKVRARGAWDFALASVATVLQFENETVRTARVVLGGVAPYPWQVDAVAKVLEGKQINGELAAEAGEAAASGAMPLRDNAYKVELVKGAVEESIAAFI